MSPFSPRRPLFQLPNSHFHIFQKLFYIHLLMKQKQKHLQKLLQVKVNNKVKKSYPFCKLLFQFHFNKNSLHFPACQLAIKLKRRLSKSLLFSNNKKHFPACTLSPCKNTHHKSTSTLFLTGEVGVANN